MDYLNCFIKCQPLLWLSCLMRQRMDHASFPLATSTSPSVADVASSACFWQLRTIYQARWYDVSFLLHPVILWRGGNQTNVVAWLGRRWVSSGTGYLLAQLLDTTRLLQHRRFCSSHHRKPAWGSSWGWGRGGGMPLGRSPRLDWIRGSSKHPEFKDRISRIVHVF